MPADLDRRGSYTEMITTGALIHGNVDRHLAFSEEEHPVALQLGGSEPDELAHAAKLGEQYGYDEINLNIGCPSERVQRGAFGACLMAEPKLVASCVQAITTAVSRPVTVKHRIGINQVEEYGFVRDFVGTVAEAGCGTFIVHARNAVLKGLSPKENREIPAAQVRLRVSPEAGFPAARDRDQRRHHQLGRDHDPSRLRRRRDARARRVPQSVAARRPWQEPRAGRARDVRVREGRGIGAPRHAPHAGPVPRPQEGPALAPAPVGLRAPAAEPSRAPAGGARAVEAPGYREFTPVAAMR
jgi:hypothetical protein